MPVKVEIVRKEMIKPSSPTPQHLKNLKLSVLDQLAPHAYIPLIFFYEANQIHGRKDHYCQLLKSSLSRALSSYYPLAGRLTDNCFIHCNDAGALFVEAKVDAHITENPDMDDLKQLLPLDPNGIEVIEEEEVLLAVQINQMDCGGTAIAVQMSHKLADGHSLVYFINAWATICRVGDAEIVQPWFDSASLFPPIDLSTRVEASYATMNSNNKIVTKRLIFSKEKLEILKDAASSIDHPTRVEVVSSLIWKHFNEVMKRKSGSKHIAASHALNLRLRMNPSLPDHSFGNIWRPTIALPEMHEIEGESNGYHEYVGKMRISIKDEYFHDTESIQKIISKEKIEVCIFTSWCRFPMYEVDYGWGKPVLVRTTTSPLKNTAILIRTKDGDGIEVFINLLEEDAAFFETDSILSLSP